MSQRTKVLISGCAAVLLLLFLICFLIRPCASSERIQSIGLVVSIFSAISALAMPQLMRWINKPILTNSLLGPWEDNEKRYWGVKVTNSGGLAEDAAIYCTGYRNYEEREYKSVSRVRLEWPYEASRRVDAPKRTIDTEETADLFSEENSGKFHFTFHPSLIKKEKANLPIYLRIVTYARGYVSPPLFVKIDWRDGKWNLTEQME